MGKSWDRLVDDPVSKSWTARGRTMNQDPGDRRLEAGGARTQLHRNPNPRCRKCGRSLHGRDTAKGFKVCHCDEPDVYLPNTYARRMQDWHLRWAEEAFRVLKPGGHLAAFGGCRTYHRLACAIEDAGFELRDSILAWMFGAGFPKSLDGCRAVHDHLGPKETFGPMSENEARELAGAYTHRVFVREIDRDLDQWTVEIPKPEALDHDGEGTALKPAYEPIVLARKPFRGTVAETVLEHGTAVLNIDACRVGSDVRTFKGMSRNGSGVGTFRDDAWEPRNVETTVEGRWPTNALLSHSPGCCQVGTKKIKSSNFKGHEHGRKQAVYSQDVERPRPPVGYADEDGQETVEAWECVEGCPVAEIDRQSGDRPAGAPVSKDAPSPLTNGILGERSRIDSGTYGDSGGASRFFPCFRYEPKATRTERELGLEDFEPEKVNDGRDTPIDNPFQRGESLRKNTHPTVKPVDLMRWLILLVTPPGGVVLDPFLGSGSTAIAATLEDFDWIGIEKDEKHAAIARARIAWAVRHVEKFGRPTEDARLVDLAKREKKEATNQLGLGLFAEGKEEP